MEHSTHHSQGSENLKVADHFKSGEVFNLKAHPEHGYLMTTPAPSAKELPYYYDSQEYISHTDSKKGLLARCYQWAKKISLKRKLKLVQDVAKKSGRLLDVGAGTGDFLKFMKDHGWEVHGSEPNDLARGLALGKGIDLAESLEGIEGQGFDVITLWHVLEHIPDLETTLDKLRSLLAADGVLLIAVPNFRSMDAKYYGPFWAAYDVPRHLWHFDQNSMRALMSSRFKLIRTEPMKFDSYYVSLLSEKYKGSSLGMFRAAFQGWRSNLKASSTGQYSSLIYVFGLK